MANVSVTKRNDGPPLTIVFEDGARNLRQGYRRPIVVAPEFQFIPMINHDYQEVFFGLLRGKRHDEEYEGDPDEFGRSVWECQCRQQHEASR